MKKVMQMRTLSLVVMTLILCLGLVGCGGSSDAPKIEKTVDAIAEAMDFTDEKQEKAFEMIGATDGAGFGDYEIYLYDENSDGYETITGDGYDFGIAVVKAAAVNNGAVLIYAGEDAPEQEIIDKFQALSFK